MSAAAATAPARCACRQCKAIAHDVPHRGDRVHARIGHSKFEGDVLAVIVDGLGPLRLRYVVECGDRRFNVDDEKVRLIRRRGAP